MAHISVSQCRCHCTGPEISLPMLLLGLLQISLISGKRLQITILYRIPRFPYLKARPQAGLQALEGTGAGAAGPSPPRGHTRCAPFLLGSEVQVHGPRPPPRPPGARCRVTLPGGRGCLPRRPRTPTFGKKQTNKTRHEEHCT